jgi:hypothetical protein
MQLRSLPSLIRRFHFHPGSVLPKTLISIRFSSLSFALLPMVFEARFCAIVPLSAILQLIDLARDLELRLRTSCCGNLEVRLFWNERPGRSDASIPIRQFERLLAFLAGFLCERHLRVSVVASALC